MNAVHNSVQFLVHFGSTPTEVPVSYTHLDVYKRQPPGISRVIDPGQPQLRQQNEQAMSLKPVSYTHLMCIRDRLLTVTDWDMPLIFH